MFGAPVRIGAEALSPFYAMPWPMGMNTASPLSEIRTMGCATASVAPLPVVAGLGWRGGRWGTRPLRGASRSGDPTAQGIQAAQGTQPAQGNQTAQGIQTAQGTQGRSRGSRAAQGTSRSGAHGRLGAPF